MKRTRSKEAVFAVCINNEDYPASLELHKIYRALPDEGAAKDGDLRIVDESGVESNPTNYRASVSGFIAEIDRMQLEVREYLSIHPAERAITV
jgi:hypothetical protein